MMVEGSESGAGSGSLPLTSGSGSGRPKNMWIGIRNTVLLDPDRHQTIPIHKTDGTDIQFQAYFLCEPKTKV